MMLTLIVAGAPLLAAAEDFPAGDLVISQPIARLISGNGTVHFTITNHGQRPDRLISASTPIAEQSVLHTHRLDEGVMKMRAVDAIEIAPGATVELKSGGLHLMLIGVTSTALSGDNFPLTLTFERTGTVTLPMAAQVIGGHHDHPGQMDHMEHMEHMEHMDRMEKDGQMNH